MEYMLNIGLKINCYTPVKHTFSWKLCSRKQIFIITEQKLDETVSLDVP